VFSVLEIYFFQQRELVPEALVRPDHDEEEKRFDISKCKVQIAECKIKRRWIPAFAGMTGFKTSLWMVCLGSPFGRLRARGLAVSVSRLQQSNGGSKITHIRV
jgi:hypothetical protein